MKTCKRVVSLLLTLVMVFCVGSVGLTAYAAESKPYKNVMAFGDSVAYGYGLPYTGAAILDGVVKDEDWHTDKLRAVVAGARVEGSYPDLVTDALSSNDTLYNACRQSYGTTEVRRLVDPSWTGTSSGFSFSDGIFSTYGGETNPVETETAYVQEHIKDSDLILLGIGMNDVFVDALYDLIYTMYGDYSGLAAVNQKLLNKTDEIVTSYLNEGDWYDAYTSIMDFAKTLNMVEAVVEKLSTLLQKHLYQFMVNWDAIINQIYELNPDTTVVAVGYFNPASTLSLTDYDLINLGEIASPIFQYMNLYISTLSPAKAIHNYKFASCWDTETPEFGSLLSMLSSSSDTETTETTETDEAEATDFMRCVHPTAAGHQYIANQIIAAATED